MKVYLLSKISVFTLLSCFLLLSCKSKPAKIIDHSHSSYTKSSYNQDKYLKKEKNITKNSEAKSLETESKAENKTVATSNNIITIAQGDTLYSVAKKYNINLRDLIEENNLSAPYSLKAGSQLKIPQTTYHEVKNGDTLYSISRQYQMNVNDIVSLNDMKAPYNIILGQKIKIKAEKKSKEKTEIALTQNKTQEIAPKQEIKEQNKVSTNYSTKILSAKNNDFIWPIKGSVISSFGPKKGGLYNDGINIKTQEGSKIKASEDGVVAYVGNELKGYGNLVILKHAGGWISAYGHLAKSNVKRGEEVKKSQIIAFAGSSGNVDSPQLYFGLRKGRDALNPQNYLRN